MIIGIFRHTFIKIFIIAIVGFMLWGNGIAYAGTALNQLCGAAGYGTG
ncbi:MAG: hypothetical protein NTX75_11650 [Proteobacteria bacterium]|nr:hypothetical protein [Pseudomonadota bacterium]